MVCGIDREATDVERDERRTVGEMGERNAGTSEKKEAQEQLEEMGKLVETKVRERLEEIERRRNRMVRRDRISLSSEGRTRNNLCYNCG
jgi:hypothetical protein